MFVSPGTKLDIPARDWNDLQAMLREYRLGKSLGGGGVTLRDEILIKNTTASDVAAFGVLAIDAPVFDYAAVEQEVFRGVRFKGIAPSTSTPHYGKFAILQEPAKANDGFARAVIGGVTLAKLNIADADDVAAEIANNQTGYLSTQAHGSARILWKESGTGTDKWGLVSMGDWVVNFIGKANALIASGSSGTVSWWTGTPGSEADTGVDVASCYNRTGIDLAADDWCIVTSILGRLYVEPWECPAA